MVSYINRFLMALGASVLTSMTLSAQTPKAGIYLDPASGVECIVRYSEGKQDIRCKKENREGTFLSGVFETYFIDGRFVGFRKGSETLVTEPMPQLQSLAVQMGERYNVVSADDSRINDERDRASSMIKAVAPENCFALCE